MRLNPLLVSVGEHVIKILVGQLIVGIGILVMAAMGMDSVGWYLGVSFLLALVLTGSVLIVLTVWLLPTYIPDKKETKDQ